MLGPPVVALPGPAGPLVEGWWTSTVTGPRDVVPDGAIDVMWSPGRAPWVAGPDTAPHRVSLPVGTNVVGVRLRVGAAAALVRASSTELVDRRVPLDLVLDRRAFATLVDQVESAAASTGQGAVAQVLAAAVQRAAPAEWSPDPLVDAAVAAIRRGQPLDGREIGERQLRRRFTHAMGYGPAFYRRVCRLDRFTRVLATGRPLAEVAAEAGYFDQAHLTRDCVALLGRTPRELRDGA